MTGASYDPLGDDRTENEDEAPNAVDGNLDTVWRTVRYNSSRLGGLKPGLGSCSASGRRRRPAS